MPGRSLLFVANWKMQFSFNDVLQFCDAHSDDLIALDAGSAHQFVVCPSFDCLYPVYKCLQGTSISLGAQTCSSHEKGAFTGEVSAQSLAQLGCTYCIIGHSERRLHFHESNEDIAAKAVRLVNCDVKPIICIGENREQFERKKTMAIISEQLKPVIEQLNSLAHIPSSLCIAYEPVWSIGTGEVPPISYLDETFRLLAEQCSLDLPDTVSCIFLYGGSVNESTIGQLAAVDWINGFLIGGASLDFQKFRNMVSLCL